ncbi:MAG: hypothetical protein ACKVT0_13670, partial [Planctomycetaceae bacterium]
MGYVIGMDEAGYGPNLGPLVVSLSVWRVPGNPHDADFWSTFSPVVTTEVTRNPAEIQIADSKKVFSTARGLKALERGVWCALQSLNQSPATWSDLL